MEQQPTHFPKPRPSYKKGFWCVIPLIGAFVGLTIVLNGIFKYKDKKYIFIGILGITWTIVVYGSMDVYLKSAAGRAGFKVFTQNNLNQTVADIELYHLQRGQYPDSLGQLKAVDSFPPIWDPVLPHDQPNVLNYGKVGDRYFLFSSGLDGIPHTQDDLYPQIAISDSSKIGLIRLK